jgi:hypothetical protein
MEVAWESMTIFGLVHILLYLQCSSPSYLIGRPNPWKSGKHHPMTIVKHRSVPSAKALLDFPN